MFGFWLAAFALMTSLSSYKSDLLRQELDEGRNARSAKKTTKAPVEFKLDEDEMMPAEPKIIHNNPFFDIKLANLSADMSKFMHTNDNAGNGNKLRMSWLTVGPFKMDKEKKPVFLYTPALVPVEVTQRTNGNPLSGSGSLRNVLPPLEGLPEGYAVETTKATAMATPRALTLEELFPGTKPPNLTALHPSQVLSSLDSSRRLIEQSLSQSQDNYCTSHYHSPRSYTSNITLPVILEDLARNLSQLSNSTYLNFRRNADIDAYHHTKADSISRHKSLF